MAIRLQDYEQIVGPEEIAELSVFAERVRNKRLQNINSTAVGGGVAEILTRLVPLLGELGIEATWDVIKGDQAFFNITKAFHNALHGHPEEITPAMLDHFQANTEANLREPRSERRRNRGPRPSAGGPDPQEEGNRAPLDLALSHRRLLPQFQRSGISSARWSISTTPRSSRCPNLRGTWQSRNTWSRPRSTR